MEFFIGMVGALLGVGLFVLGYFLGMGISKPNKVDLTEPTDDELHQIQEERRRLIQEQEAFRELMNYNPDIAYGGGNKG